MSDRQYPVGRFKKPESFTPELRNELINVVADAPARMREAVGALLPGEIDKSYREGGWTGRQVVHHVPESHMNAYIRFKLALTEDNPVIKPYDEAAWARLKDVEEVPVETSLDLLDSLHRRWVVLMRGMSAEDWKREFMHPERGPMCLDLVLALYAWHSKHHVAHITSLHARPDSELSYSGSSTRE